MSISGPPPTCWEHLSTGCPPVCAPRTLTLSDYKERFCEVVVVSHYWIGVFNHKCNLVLDIKGLKTSLRIPESESCDWSHAYFSAGCSGGAQPRCAGTDKLFRFHESLKTHLNVTCREKHEGSLLKWTDGLFRNRVEQQQPLVTEYWRYLRESFLLSTSK